jgi:hypothetical protein
MQIKTVSFMVTTTIETGRGSDGTHLHRTGIQANLGFAGVMLSQ